MAREKPLYIFFKKNFNGNITGLYSFFSLFDLVKADILFFYGL